MRMYRLLPHLLGESRDNTDTGLRMTINFGLNELQVTLSRKDKYISINKNMISKPIYASMYLKSSLKILDHKILLILLMTLMQKLYPIKKHKRTLMRNNKYLLLSGEILFVNYKF